MTSSSLLDPDAAITLDSSALDDDGLLLVRLIARLEDEEEEAQQRRRRGSCRKSNQSTTNDDGALCVAVETIDGGSYCLHPAGNQWRASTLRWESHPTPSARNNALGSIQFHRLNQQTREREKKIFESQDGRLYARANKQHW